MTRRIPVITSILLAGLVGLAGCSRADRSSPASPQEEGVERITSLDLSKEDHPDRILKGLYPSEEPWRWTTKSFSVLLDAPKTIHPVFLELDLALPSEVTLDRFSPLTLTATANQHPVGSETYENRLAASRHGRYIFVKRIPAQALQADKVVLEFETDKSFQPQDGRYIFVKRIPAQALQADKVVLEFETDKSFQPQEGVERSLIVHSAALKEYEFTKEYLTEQARLARKGYLKIIEQRDLKLGLKKQNELMRLFHDLGIWDNMRFLGVKIIKNPLDLWMMQEVIYEVRPDFIIETGTWRGGSALYWAHTLNGMGLTSSRVLTVDIQDMVEDAIHVPLWHQYVEFFHAGSTDPDLVAQISERVKGKKVLVVLDSDHHMHHVRQELRMYSPMVSPGSYIVVEDTHYDSVPIYPHFGPGPMAAVNKFLAEGGSDLFEQDFSREAMVMTFNPGGWLRRKKD